MELNDESPKKEFQPNPYAITSFVLAIVPLIIGLLSIGFLVLVDNGSLFGDAGQTFWPLYLIIGGVAALIIGIITDILAVIFGIIAIIKRKTFFSWLGIIIVVVEALILVI